eukprot:CAMPEP_0179876766 /NCGR_PEP_ID=MMETSP0982-20121206/24408_1 /TAXON_ID=483367 /ORGANISM="non described non described, Strain CCMP 2436" /LENGTH=135 /DNA_ID=CAMNT_0021769273 /DNA_START=362 /DNA_END=769 /DNA_ORIENTATION=+
MSSEFSLLGREGSLRPLPGLRSGGLAHDVFERDAGLLLGDGDRHVLVDAAVDHVVHRREELHVEDEVDVAPRLLGLVDLVLQPFALRSANGQRAERADCEAKCLLRQDDAPPASDAHAMQRELQPLDLLPITVLE